MRALNWSTSEGFLRTVAKRIGARVLGVLMLGVVASCVSDFVASPSRPAAVTIVLSPSITDTLASLGDKRSYSAQALDASGHPIAGKTITWTSSATNVATIGDSTATAVGNGTTTISASADGVSATATLVVRQEVSSVTVAPASFTLATLGSQDMAASAADGRGNPVARTLSWSWQSSNSAVVSVSQNSSDGSKATASRLLPGTVTITATAGGTSGTATAN